MNEKFYRSAKDINSNLNLNMNRSFSWTVIAITSIITIGWISTCWIKSGAYVSFKDKEK